MINNKPRNYSNDLDRRRQGLDAIVGKLNSIPDPTTDDEGKVLKVDDEGKYELADDEGTILPIPTIADEGKVVKVDDEGKYALLSDGGVQTMTVAISYDSEQQEYSADKTHAQIIAAIAAGVIVTATYGGRFYVYAGTGTESAGTPVYFSYLQADSESQFIGKIFEIDEDDNIVFSQHDLNNDTFKRRVYDFNIAAAGSGESIAVIVNVDYLQNESLVEFFPDANHPGLYPSDIAYDTQSAQKTVTLTFTGPITAGTGTIVVWG